MEKMDAKWRELLQPYAVHFHQFSTNENQEFNQGLSKQILQ